MARARSPTFTSALAPPQRIDHGNVQATTERRAGLRGARRAGLDAPAPRPAAPQAVGETELRSPPPHRPPDAQLAPPPLSGWALGVSCAVSTAWNNLPASWSHGSRRPHQRPGGPDGAAITMAGAEATENGRGMSAIQAGSASAPPAAGGSDHPARAGARPASTPPPSSCSGRTARARVDPRPRRRKTASP